MTMLKGSAHSDTIPKTIVDKNGKVTTVHVKPSGGTANRLRGLLGAPPKGSVKTGKTGASNRPTVIVGSEEWELAPKGVSGGYCLECQEYLPNEIANDGRLSSGIRCPNCEEFVDNIDMGLAISYDSQKFLDKKTVLKEKWYHVSAKKTWHDDVRNVQRSSRGAAGSEPEDVVLIHLGTLESAKIRAQHIRENAGTPIEFTCYEVQLKPNAPVADSLFSDGNGFQPDKALVTKLRDGYSAEGVNRYINQYEDVGSVSLMTNPRAFDVTRSFSI